MKRRRRIKMFERLTPCECCGWPVSHRHHSIPFGELTPANEADCVNYLCARCHELYHLIWRVETDRFKYGHGATTYNVVLLRAIEDHLQDWDGILETIRGLLPVRLVIEIKHGGELVVKEKIGTITPSMAARAHAAIEELTEPAIVEATDDADLPVYEPDWLNPKPFTFSNGE